jgi:hypothetical protein
MMQRRIPDYGGLAVQENIDEGIAGDIDGTMKALQVVLGAIHPLGGPDLAGLKVEISDKGPLEAQLHDLVEQDRRNVLDLFGFEQRQDRSLPFAWRRWPVRRSGTAPRSHG